MYSHLATLESDCPSLRLKMLDYLIFLRHVTVSNRLSNARGLLNRFRFKAAELVLFITLTKAGKTVEDAARALTTFLQHLRRGSKGRGAAHAGAREAYPIEYFAVLERHRDFEENGFHWHLLIKGRDFIPHEMC